MGLEVDFAVPAAKRQKLELERQNAINVNSKPNGSRFFAPFRTIGLVSPTPVPFTAVPLGKTTFQITTSVGRTLQTYDLRKGLSLVFLSRPQCPETITATCAYRDRVFVAWGGEQSQLGAGVWIYKRGKRVAELETASVTPRAIHKILVFGNWIIGCASSGIEVWKNETYEHYTTISPTGVNAKSSSSVLTGSICTLPTFLNKVFAGRSDGGIEIYNVSTGKLLHTILPPSSEAGAVTALAATPALSMLAVAYADGSVAILDVETEDVVVTLHQANADKPITSISFRSDGSGAGEDGRLDGVLATASIESGDVTMWDLTRGGKISGVLRGAHETSAGKRASGITGLEFLPGQPLIVTSGLDNSLKTWVFDQNPFSATPRSLHSRSGHSAPTSDLRFLPTASDGSDTAGKWLLSAAQDRSLWGFSLRKDGQSSELSQGNVKHKAKKMGKITDESSIEDFKCPPITATAISLNRDGGMGAISGPVWTNPPANNAEESNMRGWESIVTAHENDKFARTWFWGKKRAGRWAFATGDQKPVSSVAITACGTFAIVASVGGAIDTFNLQSGTHHKRFPPKLKPSQAKNLDLKAVQRGHSAEITGVIVDPMNKTMVSAALDGNIIFWDFATAQVLSKMKLDNTAPIALRFNPVSALLSLACDDLSIRVIDIETRRIVRELWGCVGQIYDHCFSHDGRWIVASSMDSVVRVFDLPTGHLIDAFKTATCTNLAFSSTGEYLATAHAGEIGVNIWNNKSLYSTIPSRQIDEDRDVIDLVSRLDFEGTNTLLLEPSDQNHTVVNERVDDTAGSAADQLHNSLLTLSLMPQNKWQTLLNLESVRARNKPIAPPEKPKAAPFFLGSSTLNGSGAEIQTTGESTTNIALDEDRSRIARLTSLTNAADRNTLSTLLSPFVEESTTPDPSDLAAYLSDLPPSATDLAIRTLTISEQAGFVKALTARLLQRRDFELVNTWMAVYLKCHGEIAGEVDDIQEALDEFKVVVLREERRLASLVGGVRGIVEFLRSAR